MVARPKIASIIGSGLLVAGLALAACQPTPSATGDLDAAPGALPGVRPVAEVSVGGPPRIVDISAVSAVLRFESSVPLACSVVYGKTTTYGQISVDQHMGAGAHTEHTPLLSGLEPDTEHHYRVQGAAADGTLYVGEGATFRTLPGGERSGVKVAALAAGARVAAVSSSFGGATIR